MKLFSLLVALAFVRAIHGSLAAQVRRCWSGGDRLTPQQASLLHQLRTALGIQSSRPADRGSEP